MPASDVQAEVDYLLERCLLILDAIERHEPLPVAQMRPLVEGAARNRNVRGLRIVRRDLIEMSQSLPPLDRQKLQEALDRQEANDPINRAR
jgi:hypothetical protein